MAAKWIKTNFPGVRYREHETRKNGVKRDQYFTIRYKLAGKDREEALGWASQNWTAAKAYAHLKELKENRKAGEGPQTLAEKREIEGKRKEADKQAQDLAEKESVTFGAFMTDTYLPQSKQDKRPRTYILEEMLYRRYLADTIGTLPFSKISAFHFERVKKSMADAQKSPRTIEMVLHVARHGFNIARKIGVYTGENPTKGVKWPKIDNMKLRYLSVTEAETLLAALAAKSQSIHDAALLSLHCGLRFGEISALSWSCWNRDAGTLAILDAKTGSRIAYLTTKAKAILEARKAAREKAAAKKGEELRPDELIFPKRTSITDGTMQQASKTFVRVVEELGLNRGVTDRKQKVTFHTLRHSFATHLYESTHDLYLTQRSLGHATGTMTARYAKMSESRLREGAAALEKVFATKDKAEEDAGEVVNFTK